MSEHCVSKPYPRKTLYLVLTIPMLVLYVAIALFLWQYHPIAFAVYLSLFVIVAIRFLFYPS